MNRSLFAYARGFFICFLLAWFASSPQSTHGQAMVSITTQPQSKSALVGINVSFTVIATGQSPLTYQWHFNGTNLTNDSRVDGATFSTLTVSNLVLNDAGDYSVLVSNKHGTATSSNAVLIVNAPPTIGVQPQSQSILAGSTATFSAPASGNPPPGYQWFFNETILPDATNSMLSVSNADSSHQGNYFVVASNAVGTAASSNAFLTVNFPPALIAEPQSLTVFEGTNVTFSATAIGNDVLHFQWQFNGTNISNATNSFLNLTNVQLAASGDYRVTVTNEFGSATSSNAALLVLIAPPVILAHPQNATIPAGLNVTFMTSATGHAPLSYQWLRNGADLNGATNSSLLLTNVQSANAGEYSVEVSNAGGTTPSSNAVLTVNPVAPTFTLSPVSQSVVRGAEVLFSSRAFGTEPITYQWRLNDIDIPGATQSELLLTNIQNSGIYKLIAMNPVGSNSATATLTFIPPPGFLWARKGGGNSTDEGKAIAVDSEGNICVAGSFSGTANFGGTNLVSNGSTDIFVAKYNSFGQLLWIQQAGGLSNDGANGIATDTNGNIIITGSTGGPANFGGNMLTNSGGIFVAKYNPDGISLWVTNSGGPGSTDKGNAVSVGANGNLFVTGSYGGSGKFGSIMLTSYDGPNIFTACYSADGDVIWAKGAGAHFSDVGLGIALDRNDNAYVAGSFSSPTISFGLLTLTNYAFPSTGNDCFIAKYDSIGNLLWAQKAGSTNSDSARGIAVDESGNVFVTGDYFLNATFGNISLNASNSSAQIFLTKFNSAGVVQWAKSAGGTGTDIGNAVALDLGGNAYISGRFSGTATFGNTNISASGTDVFMAMYTAAGDFRWVRRAGGPFTLVATDIGQGIATDDQGNVYGTGSFTSSVGFGHITLESSGGSDFFITKLAAFDSSLAPIFTSQLSNQVAIGGANVTLSPGFISGAPVQFQWYFNGTNILGATNAVLTLTNVGMTNVGGYLVVVANGSGSVTSAMANVTVTIEPGFIWAAGVGGAGDDEILGVALDTNGNTYVAGYFSGTAEFGENNPAGGPPGTNLISAGGQDIFVAKYGTNKNLIWVTRAGGVGNDRANGIAFDVSNRGGIIIAGEFSGTANFNGTNRTSVGGIDLFIARYDLAGNLSWVQQGGGTGNDSASGISILPGAQVGQVFVSGTFQNFATIAGTSFSGAGTNDGFIAKYSTSGSGVWVRGVGGSGDDRGRAVTCDAAGNSFLVGSFTGSANFSGTNLTSVGGPDAFVVKFNTDGIRQWARKGGTFQLATGGPSAGLSNDVANAVIADPSGNVFVSGSFHNAATFGATTLIAASTNQPDAFIAKYDSNGNVLWAKPAGGSLADSALTLATDFGGNAYVSGFFNGAVQFGSRVVPNAGGSDMFVAMYDANGIFLKTRRGGGAGDDVGQTVAFDGSANAIVGGSSTAPATFGGTALDNAGSKDAFFTKISFFDPSLAPIITSQPFGVSTGFGSNATFSAGVLSSTPVRYQWFFNGNPLGSGTNGSLTISNANYSTFGNYSVIASNTFGVVTSAVAVLTTELTNQVLWTLRLGSTGDDQGLATVIDAETNVYVAGVFSGTVAFGSSNLVSSGLTDIFLAKFNSDGGLIWAQKTGGTGADLPQSLSLDKSGNLLMAGQFQSLTVAFGSVSITNVNNNYYDMFIAKYDSDGNVLWAKRAGGIAMDQATSVATDDGGNAYLTGSCSTPATFGNVSITNFNATNFFLAKYDPSGNVVWAKSMLTSNQTFNATNHTHGSGVTVDANTNVFVTGFLAGIANFGNGFVITNTNSIFSGFGNATVFVAKYDANGALQWAKTGGTNGLGYGQAIKADAHGNVYATSYHRSYGVGVFLTKYDNDGNILWYRTNAINCCTGDYLAANGLALDAAGNPVITGFGDGSIQGITNFFSRSGYVLKYRSDGTGLWFQFCGTSGNSVAVDPIGNVFVAGRFSGTAFFGASSNLVSAGGNDGFLVKFGARPPGLLVSPSSQDVIAGLNVTLQVTVSGTGPFAYQWKRNGVNINGATNSSLTLNNFGSGNAGSYTVVVLNTAGSVTSAPAVLSLIPVLKISLSGNGLVFTWGGTFTLQTATNILGPYLDVPSVTSPFTNEVEPTDIERFFRLRSP